MEPCVDLNKYSVGYPSVECVVEHHRRPSEHHDQVVRDDDSRGSDAVGFEQDEESVKDDVGEEGEELEVGVWVAKQEVEEVGGDHQGQDRNVDGVVNEVPALIQNHTGNTADGSLATGSCVVPLTRGEVPVFRYCSSSSEEEMGLFEVAYIGREGYRAQVGPPAR